MKMLFKSERKLFLYVMDEIYPRIGVFIILVYNLPFLISAGKSSVLLDVKPWDDETDMKKLEETVRGIQMEGLHWGACKLFLL